MYALVSQTAYGIQHYVVDEKDDLETLPSYRMGCTAYVINEKAKYIVNGKSEWVKISGSNNETNDSEEETIVS